MFNKDLVAITINAKVENMKHYEIEGGTVVMTKFADGTISETKSLNDVVFMRFNRPILIEEDGNVVFTDEENENAIKPLQSIKISKTGIEII